MVSIETTDEDSNMNNIIHPHFPRLPTPCDKRNNPLRLPCDNTPWDIRY